MSDERKGRRFTIDVEMTDAEADRFFDVLADLAVDWEPEGVDAVLSMGPEPTCDTEDNQPTGDGEDPF